MNDIYNLSRKEQAYTIYGLLLGDASLQSGKRIREYHSNKQREYIKSLAKLFNRWGLETYTKYDYLQKQTTFTDETIYSYVSAKLTDPMMRQIERMYKDGKKIVTPYVMQRVTPFGLLLWWLDDGCLTVSKRENTKEGHFPYKVSRYGYLNTHSFSDEEKYIIISYLKSRFDIDSKLMKDKSLYKGKYITYYRNYFNATNLRKFIDVVYPYLHFVPEDMLYKLNMQYDITTPSVKNDWIDKYTFYTKEEVIQKQKYYCSNSKVKSEAQNIPQG
jgi:hypothetical protein